jgi:hypothetical protein
MPHPPCPLLLNAVQEKGEGWLKARVGGEVGHFTLIPLLNLLTPCTVRAGVNSRTIRPNKSPAMNTFFASLFILIVVVLIEVLVENLLPIGLATVTVRRK